MSRVFRHMKGVIAAAAVSIAVHPAGADVKAGVDAWQARQYDVAVREWRPLAEQGDPDAQFNLGQAYKLGRGVPADLNLARSWYEKAAQQGHAQAQANLGLILFQDGARAQAMPWIRKAADQGDPRAQYVLGTALFNGDLIARDWPRAYALMSRAAAHGLPQAATSLAEMNKHIPLEERLKGLELARSMKAPESDVILSAEPASTKRPPAPAERPVTATAAAPAPAGGANAESAAGVSWKLPSDRPQSAPAPAQASAQPAAKAPAKAPPATLASPGGKWRVQLGAFGSPAIARNQWTVLRRKIGALAGLDPSYEAAGALTRLRVGPLANRAAAERLCAAAKASGQACFPVAP